MPSLSGVMFNAGWDNGTISFIPDFLTGKKRVRVEGGEEIQV